MTVGRITFSNEWTREVDRLRLDNDILKHRLLRTERERDHYRDMARQAAAVIVELREARGGGQVTK